ncbi:MarR family winged helix-turn-helix transcriptional regulator [Saccharospirillum mangrovi]|uniref:MarR family winged helix-turn-helix transcriptional regulator n=1 Tax=Saccharospirillum mangrovi TaxID=2161747 RepID=UPI000D35F972|nr:MarR family winged helix-turn-helix transcriptional regulator [Saccharospirillum mangrovi]
MKPQPQDSQRFQVAVRRYGMLIKPVMAARFEQETGHPFTDFPLLASIAQGVRSPSDISKRIQVSNSRVSHLIERGLNQGLIERELDPTDSRRFLLSLTDKGETLVQHVSSALHDLVERSGLSQDELLAATSALEKLATALTEEL